MAKPLFNGELDGFPSEFPYEVDSFGGSTPVESVAGSTETESSDEEEDFFAGLTRRLSHESRKQQLTAPITATTTEITEGQKTRGLAGSPQSTLSGIGSWSSGRNAVSGDAEKLKGSSRVAWPSTTSFGETNDPWEAIYAAAGQVARLKLNGEVSPFDFQNNRGSLGLPRSTTVKNTTNTVTSVPTVFSNHNSQVQQRCGSVWGRQARPNWLVQQQQQLQAQKLGFESVKCTRSVSLPQTAWPSVQVQNQNQKLPYGGSGSRVVVPGGSVAKRGCGGTGVFLPRHYEKPSEPRKKSTGCAPVMLPAKVVHALNLNIDDLNAITQPHISNAFATDYDALLARRNALLMQQRLLSLRREEVAHNEVRLPQEWTY